MAQLCSPFSLASFPSAWWGAPHGRTPDLLSWRVLPYRGAAKFMDPIVALPLVFSSSQKYTKNILLIFTLPDREIALGGSRFGFNCHFRGHIKMRLSSSKLWPDLSKPERAHHQAQSCYETFLGEPRLCCRFRGPGQWRGIH